MPILNITYTVHEMKRFSLEKTTKKTNCVSCNKKTYVRFVDYENNHLPEKYGRCDREDKCGYFLSPYHDGYAKENIDLNFELVKHIVVPELPTSYLDYSVAEKSFKNYENNPLFIFLCSVFTYNSVFYAFEKYRVGILNDWCIFWQFDFSGRLRSGKYISYSNNGHRNKDKPTTWEHSRKELGNVIYPEFNLKQCFFGEHILSQDLRKPIAIVESEKTAIIASLFIDKYIWISCGAKGGLAQYKCEILKNRSVTLFPDLGAFEYWDMKAKEFGFNISNHIENIATEDDRLNGLDIADYLLR